MYALLGMVAFDVLQAPTDLEEKHTANFAQHNTINGKPKLQALGNDLTELELSIRLHYRLGNVNTLYNSLLAAKESQKAQPLIFGWSDYKGYFVITDLTANTLFTDGDGNVLAREMTVSLKEFVGETVDDPIGDALQIGAQSPLGSLISKGDLSSLQGSVQQLISRGVRVYRQVANTLNDVRSAVVMINKIADNPALVMIHLPGLVGSLAGSITHVSDYFNDKEIFNIAGYLPAIGNYARGMQIVISGVEAIKTSFESLFEHGTYENKDWVELSFQQLDLIDYNMDSVSPEVSKMTAWVSLREDANNATDFS